MDNYCPNCGKQLEANEVCDCTPNTQPVSAPDAGYVPPVQQAAPAAQPAQPNPTVEKIKSNPMVKTLLPDLLSSVKNVFLAPVTGAEEAYQKKNLVAVGIAVLLKAILMGLFTAVFYVNRDQSVGSFFFTFFMSIVADAALFCGLFVAAKIAKAKVDNAGLLAVVGFIALPQGPLFMMFMLFSQIHLYVSVIIAVIMLCFVIATVLASIKAIMPQVDFAAMLRAFVVCIAIYGVVSLLSVKDAASSIVANFLLKGLSDALSSLSSIWG